MSVTNQHLSTIDFESTAEFVCEPKERKRMTEILLVEDDPGDIDLMIELLNRGKMEHRMTVVDCGDRAMGHLLGALKRTSLELRLPDLIILDLNLPKKDGRQILRWLKSHNELKQIPVVVFTTSKAPTDIERCYASGANCYITKPVEFSEFADIIDALKVFWLKTVKMPPLPDLTKNDGRPLAGEALRLLLVEDDPGDAFFFQEILTAELGASCSVTVVESVDAALEALENESFDMIVSDLQLGRTQGMQSLESLLPAAKDLPIVVLTGINDENTGQEAVRKGAQDFISKDQIDAKRLVNVLRFSLARHRIRIEERKNADEGLANSRNQYTVLENSLFKGIHIARGKGSTIGF